MGCWRGVLRRLRRVAWNCTRLMILKRRQGRWLSWPTRLRSIIDVHMYCIFHFRGAATASPDTYNTYYVTRIIMSHFLSLYLSVALVSSSYVFHQVGILHAICVIKYLGRYISISLSLNTSAKFKIQMEERPHVLSSSRRNWVLIEVILPSYININIYIYVYVYVIYI